MAYSVVLHCNAPTNFMHAFPAINRIKCTFYCVGSCVCVYIQNGHRNTNEILVEKSACRPHRMHHLFDFAD